jgi:DNA-binding transcriptional LysR family regulator
MDARVNLDLNDVALFLRVVQTRSFTAAARERGLPVSTVSRRIARLESALGTRLLERTTRSLTLTDAGRTYFGYAVRAVEDLGQGTDRVRQLQKEPHGRLRILAPLTLGAPVASVLYTYLATYPGVSVELDLADRGRRADLLADEAFDIAILTGKVESTDAFVARELWQSSRKLLYASPRYLEARGTPRKVADLARHACIATRAADGVAVWALGQGRRKQRVTFEPRFYVTEFSAAYGAVLAGLGIAMMPEVHCARDVAAKRLVRVLPGFEGESGGVSMLYRAHRSLTAVVRTCVDHFLSELPASDPARVAKRESASPRMKIARN